MRNRKKVGLWILVALLMVIFSSGAAALYETPVSVVCSAEYGAHVCGAAIDGYTGPDVGWWSGTSNTLPQWIYGDLGSINTISGVRVVIASLYQSMTMNIDVYDGLGGGWITVESGWTVNTGGEIIWVEKTFTPTTGRYVRLYQTSSTSLEVTLDNTGNCNEFQIITETAAPQTCPGCAYVFVTSGTYDGNLKGAAEAAGFTVTTGLDGADALCQDAADNADPPLSGDYVAWLSASGAGNYARDRINHASIPYKLVDGVTLIADDWNDLFVDDVDGNFIKNPINKDESGNTISPYPVWTGTRWDGIVIDGYRCNDWEDTSADGRHGYTHHTSNLWTSGGSNSCSMTYSLFCFENVSANYCGNNVKEVSEQCDGTDLNPYTNDCGTYPGFTGGTLACLADCSAFDTNGCTIEVCGNGVLEGIEECDDSNTADCDGCKGDCLRLDAVCGDGIPECGEECDDGNTADGDGCDSNCIAEVCGNGVIDTGEICDDGNDINGDGCNKNCQPETFYLKIPKIADIYKAQFTISGTAVDLVFDVGNDGTPDGDTPLSLTGPEVVSLDTALNDALISDTICPVADNEVCTIPIKISAASGTLSIHYIDVEYTNYYWDTSSILDGQNFRVNVTAQEAMTIQ